MLEPIELLKKYGLYELRPNIACLATQLKFDVFPQDYEEEASDFILREKMKTYRRK